MAFVSKIFGSRIKICFPKLYAWLFFLIFLNSQLKFNNLFLHTVTTLLLNQKMFWSFLTPWYLFTMAFCALNLNACIICPEYSYKLSDIVLMHKHLNILILLCLLEFIENFSFMAFKHRGILKIFWFWLLYFFLYLIHLSEIPLYLLRF